MLTSDLMELREEEIARHMDAAMALLDGFDHAPRVAKAAAVAAPERSPGVGTRRAFRSTTPGLVTQRTTRPEGVHLIDRVSACDAEDPLMSVRQAAVLQALRRGLAIVVGLSGIIVVLQPGQAELTLGHLAALVSAICGAFASVVVRRIGREERSVVLLLYPMVANFLVMGLMLPVVYEPMPVADLGKVALIALLAFGAMSCIILAYRHAEAALIAPMQYSQILWALIFGALLFGEMPSGTTLIGAGIVIASGLYIVLRESRAGVSDNTPVNASSV